MAVAAKSGRFDEKEDAIIRDMVSKHGARNWSAIARALPGRTARQCRDRYANYLAPHINQGIWTDAEEKLLMEKHREYGSRWTLIAQFFENRSTNCLKNHWHYKASARRTRRRITKPKDKEGATTAGDEVIEKVFPSGEGSSSQIHEWEELWLPDFQAFETGE